MRRSRPAHAAEVGRLRVRLAELERLQRRLGEDDRIIPMIGSQPLVGLRDFGRAIDEQDMRLCRRIRDLVADHFAEQIAAVEAALVALGVCGAKPLDPATGGPSCAVC